MNCFETIGGDETTDGLLKEAVALELGGYVVAANERREQAVTYLADFLGIDEPAARGVIWDHEEELTRIRNGQT